MTYKILQIFFIKMADKKIILHLICLYEASHAFHSQISFTHTPRFTPSICIVGKDAI